MDTKKFFNEVAYLKTLIECPDSFRNRRAVRKQRKVIDKMIKSSAKSQAELVYEQTCNLYKKIMDANL